MQQLKSHKDFAKLFEKPKQGKVKDKENRSVVAKKKSSSSGLSPTKKPSSKSNQSSPSKSSGLSTKVTREKSSRSLRSSLLSKTEQSAELASCIAQAPSKAKSASSGGTKEHPIVLSSGESEHKAPLRYSLRSQTKNHPIILSSGESDHEAPLPSLHPRTRMSEPKEDTAAEQPVEKPKATIKPFQIKKVTEPIITRAKCLPDDDQVAPDKKYDSSLPPVEKISKSAIAPVKCQRVAPLQKNPLPIKPPPVQKITVQRPKQSSVAKAPTKRPIPPPPPPQPPPSFSIHSHLQARPHYYDNPYNCHHSRQAPYYQYQRYGDGYSHYSYPVGGESSSAYSTHPLATSYSAPYYHYQ
jgi:hypothetical protein